MAYSIQQVISDGNLQNVDLTITYIDRTDISVRVDDVLLDETTPYTWEWVTDTRIRITPVVPLGSEVMIRRDTYLAKPYHIFDAGAVFKDQTMDENFLQVLHIAQEAKEGSGITDFYADVNMHGYRVTNLGPASDLDDAITLQQYTADAQGSYQNRVVAENARVAAINAATLANKWAENPENAAVEAGNYSALHHAAKALASQNLAQVAATTATTQAGLSNTARVASEAARDAAVIARNAAQDAQSATEQVYDQFDDRYLGSKSSDPTTDNDGGVLLTGALYYRTTSPIGMRVWDGSAWYMAYASIEDLDGGTY